MENTHPFITAAKNKLRFRTGSGHLTTEDLFDLSLKDLDSLGMSLKRHIDSNSSSGSLLENPDKKSTAEQKERELALEVIKTVIDVKQTDNKAKQEADEKSRRRRFLLNLQDKKRIDALESLTADEIDAELAALDAPVA